jgi:heparosan-N-sulfate-glucuronate 5-epimerase
LDRPNRHLITRPLIGFAASLCICGWVAGAAVAKTAAYSRAGVYQTFGDLPRDWKTPYQLIDGIPLVNYGTFVARNPVTAAQYGLANYSLWLRYGAAYRWQIARHVADWLLFTQSPDGRWLYQFPFLPAGSSQTLAPGWASSLAQAQALSLLGRVYRRTHHAAYLRAIERGLPPLDESVAKGGLNRYYHGGLFFEEYPTKLINFSFNGDLQTLLGLYDVDDIVPPARSLFTRGVKTIAGDLPVFDSHAGYSLYSLASLTPPPPGYNPAIRSELDILAQVTGHSIFSEYAKRWSAP